jgi:uncharacterized MnhB-related membrane protein
MSKFKQKAKDLALSAVVILGFLSFCAVVIFAILNKCGVRFNINF